MRPERSMLLVVDMQERLVPAIHDRDAVVEGCAWLMRLAARVGVPIHVSEQYPRGLGSTVAPLRDLAPAGAFLEKVHFSCAEAPSCAGLLEGDRDQVVLCGVEAHVCVLQTALGLAAAGRQPFVCADAVGSRAPASVTLGLERARHAGCAVVSREMVLFEWAREAGTDLFRELRKDFL